MDIHQIIPLNYNYYSIFSYILTYNGVGEYIAKNMKRKY